MELLVLASHSLSNYSPFICCSIRMTSESEVFDSSGLSDEIDDDEFTDERVTSQQGGDGRIQVYESE